MPVMIIMILQTAVRDVTGIMIMTPWLRPGSDLDRDDHPSPWHSGLPVRHRDVLVFGLPADSADRPETDCSQVRRAGRSLSNGQWPAPSRSWLAIES
jgi:hypothetical protein